MKNLLLTLTLFISALSYSQNKITLTLNGLTEEVNAALQPGEHILNLNRIDNLKYGFFAKVQNTAGGSSKYVKIKNAITPNEEGDYDFSIEFDVEKKGSLDFSKEITVSIQGQTSFGNDVWLEKNILPADFDKPLWIDQYGNHFRTYETPKSIMTFKLVGPKAIDSIGKVVEASGDEIKLLKFKDFHVQLKNEGSDSWAINDSPVKGSIVAGRTLEYKLDPKSPKIDVNKPVVMHVCSRTLKEGYVSEEYTLQPWELGGSYQFGNKYSMIAECEMPGDVTEFEEEMTEIEEVAEAVEEEAEVIEETNEVVPEEIAVEVVNKCVTDSLTKQLVLYGGKLCVKDIKLSRGTTNSATLLFDSEYNLDGVTYMLAGGESIEYHNKKNHLLSATLLDAVTVNHSIGELELMANHLIKFSQKGLYEVKLSKNATINYNDKKLECKSTSNKFDLEFDKLGNLRSCTLANEISWSISTSEHTLPADSYLSFKKDYLHHAILTASTDVKIGEQMFSVVPKKKRASFGFSAKNILESFIIGEGHTTNLDGIEVAIQAESEVTLMYSEAGYSIKSVKVSSPVTIDVTKGSKVKTVEVKAGKRLIIENGKVVKVK